MIKKISLLYFLTLGFFYSKSVFAANAINEIRNRLKSTGSNAGLDTVNLRLAIALIVKSLLGFLGIIFTILIIYAGFTWMTAGGNEEKITKAKEILTNSFIGLLIVILAYAISTWIFSVFLQAVGPGAPAP